MRPLHHYQCPIALCPWTHPRPAPYLGWFAVDELAALLAAEKQDEAAVRAHLGTHPSAEWAAEVVRVGRELAEARAERTFAGFRLETSDLVPPGAVLVLPPPVPAADQDPGTEYVGGRPVSGMAVIRVGEPR